MTAKTLDEVKENLQNAIDIQLTDGNWNYDSYMHGLANGLLYCMSLIDGKNPEYLEAPDVWSNSNDLKLADDILKSILGPNPE